jgi:uroporphyrin-III C-methyltransferase/precorrin-2 dehydrogenase/sirohydrochlorin ferrochelatase
VPSGEVSLYPLFLKLEGRSVLVVGAGPIAERKIASLREAGAKVTVVAPEATDGLRRLAAAGAIVWRERAFAESDADGAWLVVAATDDAAVQSRVAGSAEERRCFVVAVDDPANASAYSGAVVRRPPFLVAISSSGAAPALTRLLREVIEYVLPGEDTIERAKVLRAKWQAEGTPAARRFDDLVRELKK